MSAGAGHGSQRLATLASPNPTLEFLSAGVSSFETSAANSRSGPGEILASAKEA